MLPLNPDSSLDVWAQRELIAEMSIICCALGARQTSEFREWMF